MDKSINNKSFFRSELNGLRAISLIFVVLHHINKEIINYSFLGVDIFFVISGYVLASSNFEIKRNNGWVFFSNFLSKRFKRLLPLLFVYLSIFGFLICLFDGSPGFTLKTGLTAIFGISNIFLYISSSNYFTDELNLNPFTQTWSLGVETQFYLIFSLFTIFTFSHRKRGYDKSFIYLIFSLSLASLFFYLKTIPLNPLATFYLTPFRFWEFGIGIITFLLFKKNYLNKELKKIPAAELCFLILILSLFLPSNFPKNGIPNLLIVFSSAGFILFLRKSSGLYKILNYKIFQWIGSRSYSFYLLSWGVITIFRWTIGINWLSLIIFFFIVVFISSFSYKFIENNFRNFKASTNSHKTILLGFFGIIINSILFVSFKQYSGKIFVGKEIEDLPYCSGSSNSQNWIVGDSHAVVFSKVVNSIKELNNCFLLKDKNLVGDGFLNNLNVASRSGINNEKNLIDYVAIKPNKFIEYISLYKPRNLIISRYWLANYLPPSMAFESYGWVIKDHYDSNKNLINNTKSLDNFLEAIEKIALKLRSHTKIIIILPSPEFKNIGLKYNRVQECTPQWFNLNKGAPVLQKTCMLYSKNPARISLKELTSRNSEIVNKLKILASKNENIYIFDTVPSLCNEKECLNLSAKGSLLYDDYNHFSNYAIKNILKVDFEKFIEKLRNNPISFKN